MIVVVGILGVEDNQGEENEAENGTGACWGMQMKRKWRLIEEKRAGGKKDDDDDDDER